MSDQINVNAIANTLQTKIDLPDGSNQSDVDFVIEWKVPTGNDPSWYRLYKSGWIEQGGVISKSANPTYAIFTKAMANTYYHINCFFDYNNSNSKYEKTFYALRETNRVGIYMGSYNAQCTNTDVTSVVWEVKGFAAQS